MTVIIIPPFITPAHKRQATTQKYTKNTRKYNKTYLSNQNTKLVKYNFVSIFQILAQWGITTALVPFAKHDSNNIKELVARVLNAVCGHAELRGYVVQQGGSKALVIYFMKIL